MVKVGGLKRQDKIPPPPVPHGPARLDSHYRDYRRALPMHDCIKKLICEG
jgi:hypothetical protein